MKTFQKEPSSKETSNISNDEVLNAIENLSRDSIPLSKNIEKQGPGGQACDLSPTPSKNETASDSYNELAEKVLRVNDKLGATLLNFPKLQTAAKSASGKVIRFARGNRKPLFLLGCFVTAVIVGQWMARRYESSK